MEGSHRVVRGALRLWRARNGVRGTLVGLLMGVLFMHGAPLLGVCPVWAWAMVAAGLVIGILWPARSGWALLHAGRRLGVGERLAALDASLRHERHVLAALLHAELRRSRALVWRIAVGPKEVGGALTVILIAVGLALAPSTGERQGEAPEEVLPEAQVSSAEQAADAALEDRPPRGEDARTGAAVGDFSPYEDLLATVLGLPKGPGGEWENSPEEIAQRLAEQEGLLRELSRRLSELAAEEAEQERVHELASLAEQVAREELRELLLHATEEADPKRAQEAYEATRAVLERTEDLARSRDEHSGEDTPKSDSESAVEALDADRLRPTPEDSELTESPTGVPSGLAIEDAPFWDLEPDSGSIPEEPAQGSNVHSSPQDQAPDGRGLPGMTLGDEPEGSPDPSAPSGQQSAPLRAGVRPAEGPIRGYVIADTPAENRDPTYGERMWASQEVEILLANRELPPPLADVVRRYFELVTQQEGGQR